MAICVLSATDTDSNSYDLSLTRMLWCHIRLLHAFFNVVCDLPIDVVAVVLTVLVLPWKFYVTS